MSYLSQAQNKAGLVEGAGRRRGEQNGSLAEKVNLRSHLLVFELLLVLEVLLIQLNICKQGQSKDGQYGINELQRVHSLSSFPSRM